MTFGSHIWLAVLALAVPVLVLFFVLTEQRAWKRLSRFAGSGILRQLTASYSPALRNTKAALVVLVVVLGCLALARPQAGHTYREEKRRGIDFIIALDVSRSMLAEDIKPNRLERAKLAIHDLLQQTEGDRVGLLAFAGSAFLQCPLTLDYDAFRQTLDSVDTGLLATQGTDVAEAILEARGSFAEGDNQKILVMITDGEDLEAEGVLEARKAGQAGIVIYTVGVGRTEGELIPVRNPDGTQDWLRDPQGELVRTRLDETVLRQVAVATNGAYVPLGPSGQGLNYVYEHGLSLVPEEERETHMAKVPVERYQWPLAFAVGCLLLEILLGTRRPGRRLQAVPGAAAKVLVLGLLGLCLQPRGLSAFTFGGGKSHYKKGDYEQARDVFQADAEADPDCAIHQYNLGAAQFRLGAYEQAAVALDKALELEKESPQFQRDVYASRGFVRFQQGDAVKADDPGKTIELWTQGLLDYATALNLHEQDDELHAELEASHGRLEQQLQDFTYERGVQDYRAGEFAAAVEAFDDALKVAAKDRHDEIFYNQANARFRLGEQQLQSAPQEAIKSWEQAIKDYGQAIEARDGQSFDRAVRNRDLVKRRLEELKQQQPQDQDSNNQEGDPDKNEQDGQDKDSNSQQANSQNQDSQQNQSQDAQQSKDGNQKPGQQDQAADQQKASQQEDGNEESQAQAAKAQQGDKDPAEPAQQVPGRMTQEQAMQLLELLRSYERKLPLGNLERIRRKDDGDGRPGRNW